MTAPASWNMLEALAGLSADVAGGTMTLAPVREDGCAYSMPIFLTYAWFMAEIPADGSTLTLTPVKSSGDCCFSKLKIKGSWTCEDAETEEIDGYTVIVKDFDPGKVTLKLTAK